MTTFRKNSFFTPTEKEVEYQEGVRKHALRLDKEKPDEKLSIDKIDDRIRAAIDDSDVRERG